MATGKLVKRKFFRDAKGRFTSKKLFLSIRQKKQRVLKLKLHRRIAAFKGIARRKPKNEIVRKRLNRAFASGNKGSIKAAQRFQRRTKKERRLTSMVETLTDRGLDRDDAINRVAVFQADHRTWVEDGRIGEEPVFDGSPPG